MVLMSYSMLQLQFLNMLQLDWPYLSYLELGFGSINYTIPQIVEWPSSFFKIYSDPYKEVFFSDGGL